jgi:hypothetical protein
MTPPILPASFRWLPVVVLVLLALRAHQVVPVAGQLPLADPRPDFAAACAAGNPFLATSLFVRGKTFEDEPAIVAFRD